MKEIKGKYSGKGKKIGIAVSRFNEFVSARLLDGCLDVLEKQGVDKKDITVVWTPGSFEIPQVLSAMADAKKFNALIALGAIIRGDTPHFEYIATETAKGLSQISLTKKIPVIFGIITSDTIEQAIERAGTKAGNKGRDAAFSALEMIDIYSQV